MSITLCHCWLQANSLPYQPCLDWLKCHLWKGHGLNTQHLIGKSVTFLGLNLDGNSSAY